jgi:hypothetical protein
MLLLMRIIREPFTVDFMVDEKQLENLEYDKLC